MSAVEPREREVTPPLSMPTRPPRPSVGLWRARAALRPGRLAIYFVAILTAFLVLYPVIMLFYGSFRTSQPGLPGASTLGNYATAFGNFDTYRTILNTIFVAAIVVAISTAVALLLAWIVTRTDVPARGALEVLIIIPFFIPGILEALGWIMLMSPRSGTLNHVAITVLGFSHGIFNIYSYFGIIFVMSLSSTSFMFLLVVSAMRGMDSSLEDAARSAGASALRVIRTVTLPVIAPAIIGGAILNAIRSMDSFEVPVLLGTPANIELLTNRIYAATTTDFPAQYGLATALGVIFIVITLAMIVFQRRVSAGKEFVVVTGKGYKPLVQKLGRWRWLAFGTVVVYFIAAAVLPLSQIVAGSFAKVFGIWNVHALTLTYYRQVFSQPTLWHSFISTTIICVGCALLSVALSTAVGYIVTRTNFSGRHALDLISWLPYTIPGIVLGLGMLWAYILLPLPFVLYGTTALLIIAFVTQGLPLGTRLMVGGLTQLSADLEDSARIHGATWRRTARTVLLPLVKPSAAAAVVILAVTFSRAVSSVVLLSSQGNRLISVLMFQETFQGHLGVVSALAVAFLLVNAIVLIVARLMGAFDVRNI